MILLLVEQPINHEYAHPPLFCNQTEDYCQKQKMPAKFNTISATINTTHQRYTSQGAPTYPFLQIVIVCISPTRPLLVLPTPEKHYKFFGFTKTDLNMKTHFKLPGEKGHVYHPERLSDDTICGSPHYRKYIIYR